VTFSSHPCLASALAGLGAWVVLSGLVAVVPQLDEYDRELTAKLTGVPGAYDIHGDGSYTKPRYRLNLVRPTAPPAPADILLCDDDPEEIFQSSPPSPSDQAVIFSNLLKRDIHHLALVTPLGWDAPDPSSQLAMRLQMDRLDSLVVGLPLSYGAAAEPVASAFQRLSIPVSQVLGETTALPVVNRIGIQNAETGGGKSQAAFTELLNEKPEPGFAPLLARWSDRIVFSLPLASEIARRGVDLKKIRIELGKSILLGPGDLWIQIDGRGRIALPKSAAPPVALTVPAASLIGGEIPEVFAKNTAPVWMQDSRLNVPQEERLRQQSIALADLAIRNSAISGEPVSFPRPDSLLELAGVVALALLSGAIFGRTWKLLALPLTAGAVVLVHLGLAWLVKEKGLLPLPLATLAIPAASGVTRLFLKTKPREQKEPIAAPALVQEVEPAPTPPENPIPIDILPVEEPSSIPEPAEEASLPEPPAPPAEPEVVPVEPLKPAKKPEPVKKPEPPKKAAKKAAQKTPQKQGKKPPPRKKPGK
jgi:hypothetical protein